MQPAVLAKACPLFGGLAESACDLKADIRQSAPNFASGVMSRHLRVWSRGPKVNGQHPTGRVMIEAAISLFLSQSDWRVAIEPGDWRVLSSTPTRQVLVRDPGRLEMRVETHEGSALYVLNLNCVERTAQAVVVERYDRNNLEGAVVPSPPGVFPLPNGPGSDVELVADVVCRPQG